jgi:hypothetical protein
MEFLFSASFFRDWDAYRCPLQFRLSRFSSKKEAPTGAAYEGLANDDNDDAATTVTQHTASHIPSKPKRIIHPFSQSNCSRGITFESECYRLLSSKLSIDPDFAQRFAKTEDASLVRESSWAQLKQSIRQHSSLRIETNQQKDTVWFVTDMVWSRDELKEVSQRIFETVQKDIPHVALALGTHKPDVLIIRFVTGTDGQRVQFTVADLKSAAAVHRYHRLQIALYHLILSQLLVEEKAPSWSMAATGEVWLDESVSRHQRSADEDVFWLSESLQLSIHPFDIIRYIEKVMEFVSRAVPLMSRDDIENVPWSLQQSCQYCPHLRSCQTRSVAFEWSKRDEDDSSDSSALAACNALLDIDDPAADILLGMANEVPARSNQNAWLSQPRILPTLSAHGFLSTRSNNKPVSAPLVPLQSDDMECLVCHLQETPFFFFAACKVNATNDVLAQLLTRDRSDAFDWIKTNVPPPRAEKDGGSFPSIVTILFSERERKLLRNLVHQDVTQLAKFFVEFDTLLGDANSQQRSASHVLEEVKAISLRMLKGTQFLLTLKELSLAHILFSSVAFGGKHGFSLLLAPQLFEQVLRDVTTWGCLNPLSPQEADAETIVQALLQFLPCAKKVQTIATEQGTLRVIPDNALDIEAKVSVDASGAENEVEMKASTPVTRIAADCEWHQVLAAASECVTMWKHRTSDTANPFVVKIVRPILPDEALNEDTNDKGSKRFEVEVIPQWQWPVDLQNVLLSSAAATNDEEEDGQLSRNVVQFTNGNFFTLPLPSFTVVKKNRFMGLLDEVDQLEDWLYFAKRTRSFQSVFQQKQNSVYKRRPYVGLVDVAAPISRTEGRALRFVLQSLRPSQFKNDQLLLLVPTYHDFNFLNLIQGLEEIGLPATPEATTPLLSIVSGLPTYDRCHDTSDTSWSLVEQDTSGCNEAQREFLVCVATRSLSVLWGPPGTGKTATLARMLWNIQQRHNGKNAKLILVIASTNTALQTLYDATGDLAGDGRREMYEASTVVAFSHFSREKIDSKSFWSSFALGAGPPTKTRRLKVVNSKLASTSAAADVPDDAITKVVFSTVWQLKHIPNRLQFDMLVVDEATQLTVPQALLADRLLRPSSKDLKIVVAGDPLQLSPIVSSSITSSVVLRNGDLSTAADEAITYVGSLFESVMFCQEDNSRTRWREGSGNPLPPHCVMLNTSYRSVAEIVQCVGRLYRNSLRTVVTVPQALNSEKALVVEIVSDHRTLEEVEATFVLDLIQREQLQEKFQSIGIVTPHRRQRSAIEKTLRSSQPSVVAAVDTTERMQGQQFDVVIVALASVLPTSFVLDLRRINVATSRAKFRMYFLVHKQFPVDAEQATLFSEATDDFRRAWDHLKNFWSEV